MEWWIEENEDCWQLFYGDKSGMSCPFQVIKALKRNSPMAEYWPTPEQSRFIVDALQDAEAKKQKGTL